MSTPDVDTQFEQAVNEVVSKMVADDTGVLRLPDGVEAKPEVLYAAKIVKRQRDTQSAFTKSQQELKALKEENNKLAQNWEQDAVSHLSSQEQARLEELKSQDPDAWRTEITLIEDNKRKEFKQKRDTISNESRQVSELERRADVLAQFNEANPEVLITDEVINNDVPPRITKKLAEGVISFEDYLEEVKTYLGKGKKISGGDVPSSDPSLAKVRGSNTPSKEALSNQDQSDYKKETF